MNPINAIAPVPGQLRALVLRITAASAVGAGTTATALAVGASAREAAVFAAGVLALAVLFSFMENAAVARAVESGRRAAGRDPVTDLASGAVAEHFVATEYAAARRGRAVTLVIFGLDGLEAFAAMHGAAAADRAVREFGALLGRLTRRMNLSARYGWRSDVFVTVLSEADADGAELFVKRVRAGVTERGDTLAMPAVSVGIAEMDQEINSPEEFVERAELALAEARAAGNGGTCVRRALRPTAAGAHLPTQS